jgi:hypothetical protein
LSESEKRSPVIDARDGKLSVVVRISQKSKETFFGDWRWPTVRNRCDRNIARFRWATAFHERLFSQSGICVRHKSRWTESKTKAPYPHDPMIIKLNHENRDNSSWMNIRESVCVIISQLDARCTRL